jgi:hypothetical protein
VLEQLLDEAALEDFSITATTASVTEVASELLRAAGWTSDRGYSAE